jgi:hypothetical protein
MPSSAFGFYFDFVFFILHVPDDSKIPPPTPHPQLVSAHSAHQPVFHLAV